MQLNVVASWMNNIDSFHMGNTYHGAFVHLDNTITNSQCALFGSCSSWDDLGYEYPIIIWNVFSTFASSNTNTQPYNTEIL